MTQPEALREALQALVFAAGSFRRGARGSWAVLDSALRNSRAALEAHSAVSGAEPTSEPSVHPTERSSPAMQRPVIDARRKLTDREISEGVALMKPTADELRAMYAGPDGWSEWENPKPTYFMGCCDCGLVHEMEFRVVRFADDKTSTGEVVDDPSLGVAFRARRTTTLTDNRITRYTVKQVPDGWEPWFERDAEGVWCRYEEVRA